MAMTYRKLRLKAPALGEAVFATTYRRMVDHFQNGQFALLSAFKTGKPLQENLENHSKLTEEVRQMGYGFVPVVGTWEGIEERSLFIPRISREHAKALAQKFNQDAYLWAKEGEWWVWGSHTDELFDTGKNMKRLSPDESFMNYTEMKDRKKKFQLAAGRKKPAK